MILMFRRCCMRGLITILMGFSPSAFPLLVVPPLQPLATTTVSVRRQRMGQLKMTRKVSYCDLNWSTCSSRRASILSVLASAVSLPLAVSASPPLCSDLGSPTPNCLGAVDGLLADCEGACVSSQDDRPGVFGAPWQIEGSNKGVLDKLILVSDMYFLCVLFLLTFRSLLLGVQGQEGLFEGAQLRHRKRILESTVHRWGYRVP